MPPLVVKRPIVAHLHYCPPFEPWGALHGVVVTLSGVLFWVGVWDILDYAVLPRGWPWRVRRAQATREARPLDARTHSVCACVGASSLERGGGPTRLTLLA